MKSSTKYLSLVGLVLSLAACGTPQQMPDMETPDAAADAQQMIQEDSSRVADAVSEETASSPEDSSVESDSGADSSDSSVDASTDSGSLVREPNVIYRIGPSVIQFETSNSATINALFIRRRDYGGSDAGCQYIAKTSIEISTGTCPVLIQILDTQIQLGDGGTSARISFTAEYGRCFDRAIGSPVIRLEIPSSTLACPGIGSVDYIAPTSISVR